MLPSKLLPKVAESISRERSITEGMWVVDVWTEGDSITHDSVGRVVSILEGEVPAQALVDEFRVAGGDADGRLVRRVPAATRIEENLLKIPAIPQGANAPPSLPACQSAEPGPHFQTSMCLLLLFGEPT